MACAGKASDDCQTSLKKESKAGGEINLKTTLEALANENSL